MKHQGNQKKGLKNVHHEFIPSAKHVTLENSFSSFLFFILSVEHWTDKSYTDCMSVIPFCLLNWLSTWWWCNAACRHSSLCGVSIRQIPSLETVRCPCSSPSFRLHQRRNLCRDALNSQPWDFLCGVSVSGMWRCCHVGATSAWRLWHLLDVSHDTCPLEAVNVQSDSEEGQGPAAIHQLFFFSCIWIILRNMLDVRVIYSLDHSP